MIRLVDLLAQAGVELGRFKIHCATGADPTPLEAFFDGAFRQWQEHQTKKNFQCDHVLSLIHLAADRWLFAGVFSVEGVEAHADHGHQYHTTELPNLDHLTGRAIVRFDKRFRQSYLLGDRWAEKLLVWELRPERMSIGDFPGYHSIHLSHRGLKTIVREQLPSWKSPLSSVSGVYLIVDEATGRSYVGSATGGGGVWQRWESYAATGHGGNKELRDVLQSEGDEYAQHFRYAILEVGDINASPDDMTARESHWKDVLCTRQFGYNRN